jgi:1-phosphofructokinase family hexose kinase
MGRILTVCLNPTFQQTLVLNNLHKREVNRTSHYYHDVAGKGLNVTRILTQLGSPAEHLTHIGGESADLYLKMNQADQIPIVYITCTTQIRTCYTLIDQRDHSATEIVEEPEKVDPHVEQLIVSEFNQRLQEADMLIISGSLADGYSPGLYPEMVREAKKVQKTVILDIRGSMLISSLIHRPDFIKINADEFKLTFGESQSIENQMQLLWNQYGTRCIITDGEKTTRFVDGNTIHHITPRSITPVNPIGSGDAFTAGFAHALNHGTSVHHAVKTGQECGILNALTIRPGRLPPGFEPDLPEFH